MANHHSLASGRFRRLVCSLAILHSLGAGLAAAQSPPFLVGGDPRVDPNDFRVTLYASGLDSPLSMQMLSDGSLLVGTEGGLLRLVDADDDGVADGPGSLVYAAVPDFVTSVRLAGDLVFVASAQTISVGTRAAR